MCVVVDKMEKLPRDKVEALLAELDVPAATIDGARARGLSARAPRAGAWRATAAAFQRRADELLPVP